MTFFGNPGVGSEQSATLRNILWGKMGDQMALRKSGMILGTSRDSGNTPTTVLRAGLVLAETADGQYTQYDPDSTTYLQSVAAAVLPEELRVTDLDGNDQNQTFGVIVAAPVKANKLIGLDDKARIQLIQRGFLFDDGNHQPGLAGGVFADETITDAAKTLVAADNGKRIIVNGGADCAITLPAVATSYGFNVEVVNHVDFELSIVSAEGDNIISIHDAAADSVTATTATEHIGAHFHIQHVVVAGVEKWLVTEKRGVTLTVAT